MEYARPEYPILLVDAAGDLIIDPTALPDSGTQYWTAEDWETYQHVLDAYGIVNNWRSSHSFPLNTFQVTLRLRGHQIDPNAVVAQRIKRLPTVIDKLNRRKFKLSEIQDIGGCRAVVSSVRDVNRLVKVYETSALKHELIHKDDYIQHPKVSGYRGIHLVYSYKSDKKNTWNGLKIEMQFQSTVQHAWATAVETVGRFTGQALKSNQGNKRWKRFFALMGSAIALREKTPLVPNTPQDAAILIADLRRYVDRLGVIGHLEGYATALKHREDRNIAGAHYFLLKLEPSAQQILVTGFKANQIEEAQQEYQRVESEISSSNGDDVVLVSADSMDGLLRAYPNYFLDTHLFIETVKLALKPDQSSKNGKAA